MLAERTADLSGVGSAYEVAPPTPADVAIASDASDEDIHAAEVLSRALLEIRSTEGPNVEMAVGLDGTEGGALILQPRETGRSVRLDVGFGSEPSDPDAVHAIRDAIERVGVTVYYDSGHVVTEGGVARTTLRSHPFRGWEFRSFDGFDISLEKPVGAGPSEIHDLTGTPDDSSLFSWVVSEFFDGWLVCDDGPDEVADFVRLVNDELSLIHVKAALNSSSHRGVSAVAYEQVTAQAQKNLHGFDPDHLIISLHSGARSGSTAVWYEGDRQPSRERFLRMLEERIRQVDLSVVIVQPHIGRSVLDEIRADTTDSGNRDLLRLQRLDMLLNETAAAAAGLGARLRVIGEEV